MCYGSCADCDYVIRFPNRVKGPKEGTFLKLRFCECTKSLPVKHISNQEHQVALVFESAKPQGIGERISDIFFHVLAFILILLVFLTIPRGK